MSNSRFQVGDRIMITRDVAFPQNVGVQLIIVRPSEEEDKTEGHKLGEWVCQSLSPLWAFNGPNTAIFSVSDDIIIYEENVVKVS